MNTRTTPNTQIHVATSRPDRCLRHHVWMAACDDCRAAHTSKSRRSTS